MDIATIPEHADPIFLDAQGQFFINREGQLERHPTPAPTFLSRMYHGRDGRTFAMTFEPLVFDPVLGNFRPLRTGESDLLREARRLEDEIAEYEQPHLAPSYHHWPVWRSRVTSDYPQIFSLPGAWRIVHPGASDVFRVPGGDAFVASAGNLFRIQKRGDAPETCQKALSPPVVEPSFTELPHVAENRQPHGQFEGFFPMADGKRFLFYTWNGLFTLDADGAVERVPFPKRFKIKKIYPVPRSRLYVINGDDTLIVLQGTEIVHQSRKIEQNCLLEAKPLRYEIE
ncbi:MAG: hypothetical protein AAFY59_15690, partial [Pseudomonadota bacterium]